VMMQGKEFVAVWVAAIESALFIITGSVVIVGAWLRRKPAKQPPANSDEAAKENVPEDNDWPYRGGMRLLVTFVLSSVAIMTVTYLSFGLDSSWLTSVLLYAAWGISAVAIISATIKDSPKKEEVVPLSWWEALSLLMAVGWMAMVYAAVIRETSQHGTFGITVWPMVFLYVSVYILKAPNENDKPSPLVIVSWSACFRLLLAFFGIGAVLLFEAYLNSGDASFHKFNGTWLLVLAPNSAILFVIAVGNLFSYPGLPVSWASFATALLLPFSLVVPLNSVGVSIILAFFSQYALAVLCTYLLLTLVQQVLIEEWKTLHSDA
jgi:hypothetical protein